VKWALIFIVLLLSGCTTYRIYVVQIIDSPHTHLVVRADVEKPLDVSTDATVDVVPVP